MSVAYLVDGIRTPIGRYAGALSAVRPDDLAAHVLRALAGAHRIGGLGRRGRRDPRLRQPGGRGQPQRRAHGGCCSPGCRPRCRARRSTGCAARAWRRSASPRARSGRRGRADDRGRRGEHEPRALRDGQGRPAPFCARREIYDTTIGWRFVNPLMKAHTASIRCPRPARTSAEEFQVTAPDQDAFALAQPAARGGGAGGRPLRARRSRRCRSRSARASPSDRRQRRASARRHRRSRRSPSCARRSASGGTVTAGNASGVNDGAAALLIASRGAVAAITGSTPRRASSAIGHRRRRAAHHGHRPGAGDAQAARAARACRSGLRCDRAQRGLRRPGARRDARSSACPTTPSMSTRNGGAIALGHPLGMPAARGWSLTAIYQLRAAAQGAARSHDVHRRRPGHRPAPGARVSASLSAGRASCGGSA